MTAVIRFIIDIEGWIYFFAIIGIIINIFRMVIFVQKWRVSQFGLEREIARKKIITSITTIALLAFLILAELFFTSYSSAKLLSMEALATPTIDVMATPTVPFNLGQTGQDQAPDSFTETSTPEAGGCIPEQLEWISPQADDEIRGVIQLIGTVNVTNLGFYKYEYKALSAQDWTTIAGGNVSVIEGELGGSWDTENVIPGDYQLRLVVTDNQAVELPACVIPIRIAAP